jgi:chromosomal replication initiation ATPase DnaA
MNHVYVKTENHRRFAAAVAMLQARGAQERCILAVKGLPGVGKTRVVDYWGSACDAVFVEGVPGMSLRYLKDALKAETGVHEKNAFAEFQALVEFFRDAGHGTRPLILDECQHGFPKKAECIEYLRRLAEKAGSMLILVCHTSESYWLDRHDHIKTRIGCVAELLPPTLEDTTLFAQEQCEVALDAALIKRVHEQSGQRYRLISDALANLEHIAARKGKNALTLEDVGNLPLCQDWEKALKPVARRTLKTPATKGGAA